MGNYDDNQLCYFVAGNDSHSPSPSALCFASSVPLSQSRGRETMLPSRPFQGLPDMPPTTKTRQT